MPRFALDRDINFFKSISRELVDAVIETTVVLYKLVIEDVKTNLYGESLNKSYYQGTECSVKNHSFYDNAFVSFKRENVVKLRFVPFETLEE